MSSVIVESVAAAAPVLVLLFLPLALALSRVLVFASDALPLPAHAPAASASRDMAVRVPRAGVLDWSRAGVTRRVAGPRAYPRRSAGAALTPRPRAR